MAFLSSSNDNLFLGIDIGDSSLKMVELKKKGKKIFLSNYAFSENVKEINFTKLDDVAYLAKLINIIRSKAGIKSRRATVSLPTFAVFSTIINVPKSDKKNLDSIVSEEAKKLIPLPLEEMILDWKLIPDDDKEAKNLRVFLTGSPKKLVRKYVEIFKLAKLELISLETETFSLVRSLLADDPSNVMIVEIGANSTDLFIVKESIPVLNRSLEVCSSTITQALAKQLGLSYLEAEQFKLDLSFTLKDSSQDKLAKLIIQTIAPIVQEIEYMKDFFENNNQQKIDKIILSGGGSLMLNLPQYLIERLNMQVIVGDPFSRLYYPQEIASLVNMVSPKLAVAVGLAMRSIV